MSDIQILAPAKVNLGLKVLPKRADGFHNIESIFQTVRLYDVLTVRQTDRKNTCEVFAPGFSDLPAENTLTKTYRAFCSLTGCTSGVTVTLEKNIPSGGGLGGGSSDAAYFLRVLSKINGIELKKELADGVASLVGSDVFFFLHSGAEKDRSGCAVVTGRGEFVRQILPRNDLFFLLVFPGVHSSTKEAYELVDKTFEAGGETDCPSLADLESVYRSPVKDWTFANSFTSALLQKYPKIGLALRDVKNSGALWSDMTGSGATVFGVFEKKQDAEKAYSLLKKSWPLCVIA
ncbi:4-(cytidine 5'-diphospho)-2-C-methyl-D-erythritol kinase [uncultured Treponema sp.]|uniref:4-(cytidine 5'-diphospho)-2-C-methyl-D-erythritol kinase n=1 Tax=uncultured Treponema sp. TaxID=162155 RepID=UPI0015C0CF21|nr:4-(cytidine 5'-diphospho)-2-C-methyl-D-erythritol kinase [uncultured Treponema sp.]